MLKLKEKKKIAFNFEGFSVDKILIGRKPI